MGNILYMDLTPCIRCKYLVQFRICTNHVHKHEDIHIPDIIAYTCNNFVKSEDK